MSRQLTADSSAHATDVFHDRWEAALRDIELEVELAEAMLAGAHVPEAAQRWRPPAGLGPLPAPLLARAQQLVDRQIEVAQRLAEALVQSRQQARVVQGLKAGAPRRPVYLDTAG